MKKRAFLSATALASLLPSAPALAAAAPARGPVLLTVSGAVGRANRGALDPALDQMMAKHGIQFDKALALDARALYRLPSVQIKPTLEYDAKVHTLSGPLLTTVLAAAGVPATGAFTVGMRAVDGYNVSLGLAELVRMRMLVATHIDGHPLALGGLGPQWAVFDAGAVAPYKDLPLKERFAQCPWGLYHLDVQRA
ncbi:MAG: molybdopterin-dependent oxidoreductase [Rhodoferax sp.]